MALRLFRSKLPAQLLSGPLLVSDFKSAMINLSTAETAKYVAEETEKTTMHTLQSVSTQNNPVYVTPGDIAPDIQDELVRSSLDAHLKKAQSQQISAYANNQLLEMEAKDKQGYMGKKIKITILDQKFKPVESYWQDSQTGEYRQGTIKFKSVKGIIDDLSFHKNVLVIKPSLQSRLILPQRKFFFVYVINPESLEPTVQLDLI